MVPYRISRVGVGDSYPPLLGVYSRDIASGMTNLTESFIFGFVWLCGVSFGSQISLRDATFGIPDLMSFQESEA